MNHAGLMLYCVSALVAAGAPPQEVGLYPEARHGRGELRYIEGIPVVIVEGTPAEMGEQLGVLAMKPRASLLETVDAYIETKGWQQPYSLALKSGQLLLPLFPPDHAEELRAAAEASDWPQGLLIFANTIPDLRRLINCSVLMVEGNRSKTGGPLFGRNLDWPPFDPIHELTFVTIYRPTGKYSFASVTFPGLLGVGSGMNEAGLAGALLDSTCHREGVKNFDLFGAPTGLTLRRVLEECATVEEAAELFRSTKRASSFNVAVCDKRRSAVLEVTPHTVVVRPSVNGLCICTNHFRSAELATSTECWRYERLERNTEMDQFGLEDIATRMHAVNQGEATLQAMIFEPAALKLHLAFGKGPATALPHGTLELRELFR